MKTNPHDPHHVILDIIKESHSQRLQEQQIRLKEREAQSEQIHKANTSLSIQKDKNNHLEQLLDEIQAIASGIVGGSNRPHKDRTGEIVDVIRRYRGRQEECRRP